MLRNLWGKEQRTWFSVVTNFQICGVIQIGGVRFHHENFCCDPCSR